MKLPFNKRLEQICSKKSNLLCIGLDPDPEKMPHRQDKSILGIECFIKDVIASTIDFCPVYKPNFAFYERFGSKGYIMLEKIVDFINGRALVIADAKRGDIGNSSKQYAIAILDKMGCDAITVSPYMGRDTILPFTNDSSKGVFILGLTSNASALEFQGVSSNGVPIYEKVCDLAVEINKNNNIGVVIGATHNNEVKKLRTKTQGLSWLIPGIGNQGGDLEHAVKLGNQNGIGIINVSRDILYAGSGSLNDVINSAHKYTKKIRDLM
tara:strand:- start:6655 stop:7455 length:801 start_codon:yes stop_codon:yes gene_type:complete